MNNLFTYLIYIITIFLLFLSFKKSKSKTILALKKAKKMFLAVLPQFLAIVCIVGLILAFVDNDFLQNTIGSRSGFLGSLLSSFIGSITLIPVLIVFPIASELLRNGAGLSQITIFICTLTTVGLVTLPLEKHYLGKKIAVFRNLFFYLSSFVISFIMGVLL